MLLVFNTVLSMYEINDIYKYNILIWFITSASSQLLLVKVKPRYLIESVYIIGHVFINIETLAMIIYGV